MAVVIPVLNARFAFSAVIWAVDVLIVIIWVDAERAWLFDFFRLHFDSGVDETGDDPDNVEIYKDYNVHDKELVCGFEGIEDEEQVKGY